MSTANNNAYSGKQRRSRTHITSFWVLTFTEFIVWHCWLGDRKGIWPVKKWMLVCWWWHLDWSFARMLRSSPSLPSSLAPVVIYNCA